jgi:ribonuclease D
LLINNLEKERRLINRFYSLVPQAEETIETVPLVMEFKPDMSYYCIKDISVRRLERSEYERIKSLWAWQEDITQSQTLAVVHFNPENILKRMNFRPLKEEQPGDANTPAEAQGASL